MTRLARIALAFLTLTVFTTGNGIVFASTNPGTTIEFSNPANVGIADPTIGVGAGVGPRTTVHSIYRETADPAKASILSVGSNGGSLDEDVDIPIPNRNEAFEIYTTTGPMAGFEFYKTPEITNSVPESRFVGFGNLIQQTTQNPETSTLAPSLLFGIRIRNY